MANILEYKGYHTKIEYNSEDNVIFGKIEGIRDLVNFESDSAEGIVQEFHSAVDDYLDFCREVGKEPDKEYKGSFNIRISPDLHKKLAYISYQRGDTLNNTIEIALEEFSNNYFALPSWKNAGLHSSNYVNSNTSVDNAVEKIVNFPGNEQRMTQ